MLYVFFAVTDTRHGHGHGFNEESTPEKLKGEEH
jgi:hypothetical protein